ncbi:MAG: hypothetical protein MHM6MM_001684 [Cercozoa sp. M6MM]
MSVLLRTSLGDLTVELHTKECPKLSRNFLRLCAAHYYDNCIFHRVESDFAAKCGDPEFGLRGGRDPEGAGTSYDGLRGKGDQFVADELSRHLLHDRLGTLSMANMAPNKNASQFRITLRDGPVSSLDGKHSVFGRVTEGEDVLKKFNEIVVDRRTSRPLRNIRIRRALVLEDPFPADADLNEIKKLIRAERVELLKRRRKDDFLDSDDEDELEGKDAVARAEVLADQEARARAITLAALGDLPDADAAPPPNVLFVCKLNPVTEDEDLEMIFSQYGQVLNCDIIKDRRDGHSLGYAFVEFADEECANRAYAEMDNRLIDNRRIKVDFSQSVAKQWRKYQSQKAAQVSSKVAQLMPNREEEYRRHERREERRRRDRERGDRRSRSRDRRDRRSDHRDRRRRSRSRSRSRRRRR